MDWPTLLTSLSSAVVVAFLGPRFQHLVWKKQKLREQRLSVAERFDATNRNFWLVTNVMPPANADDHARIAEDVAKFLEQRGVLILVMVLFERQGTLDSANKLRACLDSRPQLSSHEYPQYLETLYALRVDLLSRLFAEAFEVSTERLIKRNTAPGSTGG